MKKIGILFTLYLLVSCSHQKDYKELIKGDWRSIIEYNPAKFDDLSGTYDSLHKHSSINYRYNEVFFSNKFSYAFNNISGWITPLKYKIKSDSLYLFTKVQSGTMPIIEARITFLDEEKLIITQDTNSLVFYRLLGNKETLANFIIHDSIESDYRFKESFNSFGQFFQKRFNREFERYLEDQK